VKISVICDSLLLKNSLEIFLKDYITTYKNSDIVLSDKKLDIDKPLVLVGSFEEADIVVPFSRSSLLLGLEKSYKKKVKKRESKKRKKDKKRVWKLEREIDKLTLKFREDLIKTIREFYEE